MTRRRFQHCQNEKCDRRLAELLPADLKPTPAYCEACRAMLEKGPGPDYYATGRKEGMFVGIGFAGVLAIVVAIVTWVVIR